MADPRWLDAAIDPNERVPGSCFMGKYCLPSYSDTHT
jgi:hypothetical protein